MPSRRAEEGFRYDDESDMSDGEVVMEFESERDYPIMREALEDLDEREEKKRSLIANNPFGPGGKELA